jgi:hypothetical protein
MHPYKWQYVSLLSVFIWFFREKLDFMFIGLNIKRVIPVNRYEIKTGDKNITAELKMGDLSLFYCEINLIYGHNP